jgi:uncharacterized membrane protein
VNTDSLQSADSSTGLSPRTGAILAYGGGVVTGVILWFVEQRDPFVRFHAAQSIVTFGLFGVVMAGLGAASFASLLMQPHAAPVFLWVLGLTGVAALGVWATAIWHAARGRRWRMPIAGRVADRLTAGR